MLGSKRSLLRTLRWMDGASGAFRSFFAFKVIIFLSLAHRIFVFCKKFLEPMGSSKWFTVAADGLDSTNAGLSGTGRLYTG